MKIETGVIAAAGSGTRMLPVTLGYPKELLPIINKPAIQLIIEEFIAAGLKKIIIITGENSAPLHRQYQSSATPPPRGKYQPLDEFLDKMQEVELIFAPQAGPYGNGTPLLVAGPHIPAGEGFIYAFGDDIIKSPTSFTQQLINKHNRTDALVIGAQAVPWEDVVRYGMMQIKAGSEDLELDDIVEKPTREEAKSNLAQFGRFLLSTEIIRILQEIPLGKSNELWLTDAIRAHIRQGGKVVAESVQGGEWLTIGDPVNYLKTVLEFALADSEMRAALEPRIRALLNL